MTNGNITSIAIFVTAVLACLLAIASVFISNGLLKIHIMLQSIFLVMIDILLLLFVR